MLQLMNRPVLFFKIDGRKIFRIEGKCSEDLAVNQ